MKNKESFAIVLVVGVLLFLGTWVWWNSKKEVDWSESLKQKSYNPYDLGYFKKILEKSSSKGFEVQKDKLSKSLKNHAPANYFLVNHSSYFTERELSVLKGFVAKGNDAFISVKNLDYNLEDFLDFAEIAEAYTDSKYNFFLNDFPDKSYPFTFYGKYGFQNFPMQQFYISEEENDNAFATDIGHFQRNSAKDKSLDWWYTNCLQLKIGKGTLTVHINPVLFSNVSLKSKVGLEYANDLLAFMDDKPIIWDEYNSKYNFESNASQKTSSTPFQFVFGNKALKTAWFTLLLGTLVFLLFKSKRKQNIIPILPQLENTSLEFSKSLGALYLQSGSGKALAIELMTLFDNYNRRRYRIHRSVKDQTMAEVIAQKSRVDIQLIQKILLLERKVVFNPESNIKDVMPLYEAIKEYYNKSKR